MVNGKVVNILKGVLMVGLLYGFTATVLHAEEAAIGKTGNKDESLVIFQDNFSDPEITRKEWSTTMGPEQYDIEDGVLRLKLLKTGGGYGVGDETWQDYIFSAKMRFVENGEGANHAGFWLRNEGKGGVCIMVRQYQGANSISYFISDIETGKYAVSETVTGLDQEEVKVSRTDGKWHYYRFTCKRDTINIWVDGKDVGVIKQVPLKGGIALHSFNDTVEFGDVLVMRIK